MIQTPQGRDAGFKQFLLTAAFALACIQAHAQHYVQNAEDREKIEQAIPTKAIVQAGKPRRLLIFTLNVGYGGHPSMAYASEAFTLMGRKTGAFETEVSQDPAVFSRESLKRFDAVFFNNTVGNCFTNADLRRNLLEFVTGGGGLLGVHGTTVAFTRWPGAIEDWPEFGYLIGARGANHKDSDEHIWMKVEDPRNPITRVFGHEGFDYRDEFFRPQGTYSRDRVRVLLSIDSSKCDPNNGQARGNCYRADNDYAVAWIRNYGRGRVFYCTIAHNPYVFWDPKMLQFYLGVLQFALGDLKCPTTPSAKLTPAVIAREQLGWKLGLQSGAGRTFAEDIQAATNLHLAYVGATESQPVSDQPTKLFDPELTDSEREQLRLQLEAAGLRLVSFCLQRVPADETGRRRLIEFCRDLGIETVITPAGVKLSQELERQCRDSGINLAAQYGPATAAEPMSVGAGVCLHWAKWMGAPDAIKRKLLVVRLGPDFGSSENCQSFVAEAARLAVAPIFLVEEPSGAPAVSAFDAACVKLQKGPL